ncbi:MAG TPA: hypothetical protein VN446_09380, partial [Candidatus Acidoferrum sp.]|nr:hypothetical protein [Candidatus Acidoferrum sp.]
LIILENRRRRNPGKRKNMKKIFIKNANFQGSKLCSMNKKGLGKVRMARTLCCRKTLAALNRPQLPSYGCTGVIIDV